MKPETSCEQGDQELSSFERGKKIFFLSGAGREREREKGEKKKKE